jgi:SAM-dependent methyltransferase
MSAGVPKDGRSWDSYSEGWAEDGVTKLGVEWGNEELTRRIFERSLQLHLRPESHVLEIGPGGGKYSVLVAPLCARFVYADVSLRMLERTRAVLGGMRHAEALELGGIDLTGLDDESMDFVLSIDVFMHLDLEDVYGYLREFSRVLRPGGVVVVHFAGLLNEAGWGQFQFAADFNRAHRRQVGRINFLAPEMATRVFEQVGYQEIFLDKEVAEPRDFIVTAKKPRPPADPEEGARRGRISKRTGSDSEALDFLSRLPCAVRSTLRPESVRTRELELAGDRRQAFCLPSPSRIGFALTIPERALLCGAVAVIPAGGQDGHGGGTRFALRVIDGTGSGTVYCKDLHAEAEGARAAFEEFRIDLRALAGKVVFLAFDSEPLQPESATTEACWAEPALVVIERNSMVAEPAPNPVIDFVPFDDPDAERRMRAERADSLEHELEELRTHAARLEKDLQALGTVAAQTERALRKIRSNRVYRGLCWL